MNSIPTYRHSLSGILAAAGLALSTFSMSTSADELLFKLSGDVEVPPVATMASGTGAITVNPDMTVSGKVTTSGTLLSHSVAIAMSASPAVSSSAISRGLP